LHLWFAKIGSDLPTWPGAGWRGTWGRPRLWTGGTYLRFETPDRGHLPARRAPVPGRPPGLRAAGPMGPARASGCGTAGDAGCPGVLWINLPIGRRRGL